VTDAQQRRKIVEARVKLRADFINRMDVNFVIFGFVTPAALLLDEITAPAWLVLLVSLIFIGFGFIL